MDITSHPETNRLLREASPPRRADYELREDLLDAVICAWTAAYWHRYGRERCQLLGLTEGQVDIGLLATIIAPARREQRSASVPPRG